MDTVPEKICASCGRRFAWRRKWARTWDDVRYCSDACRRRKLTAVDRQLDDALGNELQASGSADPATVARTITADPAAREAARRAARRLVAAGRAELVQRGRVVDPTDVRGDFTVRAVR